VTVVLDASAAVTLLSVPDGFAALGPDRFVAPALLWSEVTSVLHRAVTRSQVSREFGRAALDRLLTAPIGRVARDKLFLDAWTVAEALGWSKTYDAEYIALARLERCPLVTADARQRRAAGRFVTVHGLDELIT
jgi:predicted nucleic acid-binding protein